MAPDPAGEFLSISERLVVSPAWGTFHGEYLVEGHSIEEGTVIGRVSDGLQTTSLLAHATGSFVAWLVEEGELVVPGRPVARLRAMGG